MPYNVSINVCRRMERYLKDLDRARQTIQWASKHPNRDAYKLREALEAVRHHTEFARYHELKDLYAISVKKGAVEARYLGIEGEAKIPLKGTRTKRIIKEVTSLNGVVGSVVKFTDNHDEIHFPNANLGMEDKNRLFKFAEKKEWKVIDHGEGLTLTQRDVDESICWTPDEAE